MVGYPKTRPDKNTSSTFSICASYAGTRERPRDSDEFCDSPKMRALRSLAILFASVLGRACVLTDRSHSCDTR